MIASPFRWWEVSLGFALAWADWMVGLMLWRLAHGDPAAPGWLSAGVFVGYLLMRSRLHLGVVSRGCWPKGRRVLRGVHWPGRLARWLREGVSGVYHMCRLSFSATFAAFWVMVLGMVIAGADAWLVELITDEASRARVPPPAWASAEMAEALAELDADAMALLHTQSWDLLPMSWCFVVVWFGAYTAWLLHQDARVWHEAVPASAGASGETAR